MPELKGDPGLPPLRGVPCVARLVRLPHKLARSAARPRAQTYSSEFPDQPARLGGAQGRKNKNLKNGWQQVAHHNLGR